MRVTPSFCLPRIAWQALEEEKNWHLQNARDLVQAACADAVGALFVFLDLLECEADGVGGASSRPRQRRLMRLPGAAEIGVVSSESFRPDVPKSRNYSGRA